MKLDPDSLIENLPNSMKPDRIEEKIDLRVVQTFAYAVYMQQDTLFKTLSITGKPRNISVCKLPSLTLRLQPIILMYFAM